MLFCFLLLLLAVLILPIFMLFLYVFTIFVIIINFFIFLLFLLIVVISIRLCFLIQITDSVRYCFHNYFFLRTGLLLLRCGCFSGRRLCLLKLWVFDTLANLLLLARFLLICISLLIDLRCYSSSRLCHLRSRIVYFGQFHSLKVVIHRWRVVTGFVRQEVSWAMLLIALSFPELIQSRVTSHSRLICKHQFIVFLDPIFVKSFI